jgi:hypothetical protein
MLDNPERLEHLVLQEQQACRVLQDSREGPAVEEPQVLQGLLVPLDRLVVQVQQVFQDHLEQLDLLDRLVQLESMVQVEAMVYPDHLEQLVLRVQVVVLGLLDPQVVRVRLVQQELLEQLVHQELMALLVQLVVQELQVLQVHLEYKDLKVFRARQEALVHLEHLDQLVSVDNQEIQVLVVQVV